MTAKWKDYIRYLALMTALIMALSPLAFAAADDGGEDELFPDFYAENPFAETSVCTWKDIGAKKNAALPVYSAPFPDAFRPANGKAVLGTGSDFTLLGTLQGGTWAMVEYLVDSGRSRVGWIELPESAPQRPVHCDLDLNRRPAVLTAGTVLTDDPARSLEAVASLQAGQRVIAMFVCRMEDIVWVYVETEVEGQVCWGFVMAQALSILPSDSLYHLEDNRLIIAEGVSSIGETAVYASSGDGDSSSVFIRPGDIFLSSIELWPVKGIRGITFPDSLRALGSEAFFSGSVEQLRLDGRITHVNRWCFYGTHVSEFILAADYVHDVPEGEYLTVSRWNVEAGNARYSSRDGVLFSADGKALLDYPNGRKAEHYDIPAGTEVIGERAFDDDQTDLPLKTVSLPIGLKRIEAFAFCGCGRLMSLTVPLTVTELDPTAFENCVSLERLSLPPGLTAEFDTRWAERGDFTYYNGDNGGTLSKEKPLEEWEERESFHSYPVLLDNPEGAGEVTAYTTSDGNDISAVHPVGRECAVYRVRNGRAMISYPWNEDEPPQWVPLANTRVDFGNVLFELSDAEIINPEAWVPEGRAALYWYQEEGGIAFDFSDVNAAYESESVTVPYSGVVLYRDGPDDGRTMGILYSDSPSIPLYDAPGGGQTDHLYPQAQALLLEDSGEWLRIRTPDREGWIPAACFLPVLPKTNP